MQDFPATLRGADEIDWYTTAWFDKYVKGDPSADSRLLTNRWHSDKLEAAVPKPILHLTMGTQDKGKNEFALLVSDAKVNELADYYKKVKPALEAPDGTDSRVVIINFTGTELFVPVAGWMVEVASDGADNATTDNGARLAQSIDKTVELYEKLCK